MKKTGLQDKQLKFAVHRKNVKTSLDFIIETGRIKNIN